MTTEDTEELASVILGYHYQESVKKAMTALDEEHPGWWSDDFHWDDGEEHPIDLNELDMANQYKCVLGQLFGDYEKTDWSLACLTGFGGDIEFGSGQHPQLTEVWRNEITARRRSTSVPMVEIPTWATRTDGGMSS